ncbi:MAG: alpha/beta hydrolase [Dysgonomonas sp.]|nr:alpha/beta hydrolase [Dysgonomonas sp.]
MKVKKILKIAIIAIIMFVVLANVIIAIQAYSLSHFKTGVQPITPEYQSTFIEKIKITFCGLDLPKPKVGKYPDQPYDSLFIPNNGDKQLEAWILRTDSLKQGLAILFHGYMDEKSSMLNKASVYNKIGYDVMLINFMGAGKSYGNQTTIGFLEAENVKDAYDFAVEELKEDNILLHGFSMGAAAIIKAQHDYDMPVSGLILEAPYGNFQGTINARLDLLELPHFLISDMFTFWFGKINGFNAFDANPEEYAKKVFSPVLLMCGGKDQYISQEETERIFDSLASRNKELFFFQEAIHENYLNKYPDEWENTVSLFIDSINKMDVYYE